jgi:hypothetical protein
MRYIDILERYRKDYKISVSSFIEDVMSVHTYYRYLNGNTDLKVSQAVALLKKTDIDAEALFSYLSDITHPNQKDLEQFLEQLSKGYQPRTEQYYKKLMTDYTYATSYIYKTPYKKHVVDNEKTLFKQAMDLIVLAYGYEHQYLSKEIFYTYLSYANDVYITTSYQNIYALVILSILHTYEMSSVNVETLMTQAMEPSYFKEHNWDLSFIIFKRLTKSLDIETYLHVKHAYIKYVSYMITKLTGTLDIGFILHVYYHATLIHFLLENKETAQTYCLRVLMTLKFNVSKTQQHSYYKYLKTYLGPLDTLLIPYIQKGIQQGAS